MKVISKTIASFYALIIGYSVMGQQFPININTYAVPPLSPYVNSMFSTSGNGIHVMIQNISSEQYSLSIVGEIDRLFPSTVIIKTEPSYVYLLPDITLQRGQIMYLNNFQLNQAFGNFQSEYLIIPDTGISSINDIKEGLNYKLPEGQYKICFRAFQKGNPVSDSTSGCATFNICSVAAPQFIQPVNDLNISSSITEIRSSSPVVFTWLPPRATCGVPASIINYDFEIREIFDNQTLADAVNNPYVFRKMSLPSTTFLLDTNLYRNVLQEGKKYIIRVKANAIGSTPLAIDNNGYSRIEAFQYGGNIQGVNPITQNAFPEPRDYYIQFEERKSDYWGNVYEAYKRGGRGDTFVPIKEYIAFALTQNGTAYSTDAIELFLALNPELADVKKVKISYTPKLPEYPKITATDQRNFDKEHITNHEPDIIEKNKFLRYLDTLNNYKQKIPENAGKVINDLVSYLNTVKPFADSIDRITVSLINQVLSELLYELRQYPKEANKNQYNQLLKLSSTLQELTALSPNSTSFFYSFPVKNESSLSLYKALTIKFPKRIFSTNSSVNDIETDSPERVLSAIMKQLLPFDVIVWRNSTVATYKPVLDAPDLTATYRIFYTLSGLYNHKNPEVNAKSTSRLASTVQISLPSNTVFSFWTVNMLNHKMTQAEDVDLKDVLINSMKNHLGLKKPSIVLKVN